MGAGRLAKSKVVRVSVAHPIAPPTQLTTKANVPIASNAMETHPLITATEPTPSTGVPQDLPATVDTEPDVTTTWRMRQFCASA